MQQSTGPAQGSVHLQHPRKDALRIHHVPGTMEKQDQNEMSLLSGVANLAKNGHQVQRVWVIIKKGSGKLS